MHFKLTPDDLLIWDVGHRHGHKIMTGRRDDFHTNRQLTIYPKKSSIYDAFGVATPTSISAALGMAIALT
jgi:1-deoxy-D-xylulose-5-phosphate synthase